MKRNAFWSFRVSFSSRPSKGAGLRQHLNKWHFLTPVKSVVLYKQIKLIDLNRDSKYRALIKEKASSIFPFQFLCYTGPLEVQKSSTGNITIVAYRVTIL